VIRKHKRRARKVSGRNTPKKASLIETKKKQEKAAMTQ
jgi:hypothetical protein